MAVNLSDSDVFSPAKSFPTYGALVDVVVANAFVLAGIASFILLIFGGFRIIVAGGDTKKLEQGRGAVTGAVTGLLLTITSYWIVQIIEKVSGVTLLGTP